MVESPNCEEPDEFDVLIGNLQRDVVALNTNNIELLVAQATIVTNQIPRSINERKEQRRVMKSVEEQLTILDDIESKISPLRLLRDLLSSHLLNTRLCRKVFSPACIPIRKRNQERMAQLESSKLALDKLENDIPKLREQIYHLIMCDIACAAVSFAITTKAGPEPPQAVKTIVYGCNNFTALFAYGVPVKGALANMLFEEAKAQLTRWQLSMDSIILKREDHNQDERPRLVLLRHQTTSIISYIESIQQKIRLKDVYTLVAHT